MKLRKHLIILMQEDFLQDAYKSMTNNFKGNQVKKVTYTGSPIRLSIHFSPETLQERVNYILKILKNKVTQEYSLVKLSFRYEREIKIFSDKQKLREFIPTRLALQNRLFATSCTVACTRLLCPWDFLGKSPRVGCHFLLQGIFLTQVLNPGLPH